MLAEPWVHISTGLSLVIVGGVIAIAVIISVIAAKPNRESGAGSKPQTQPNPAPPQGSKYIQQLAHTEPTQRLHAADFLFSDGKGRILAWLGNLIKDEEFQSLIVQEHAEHPYADSIPSPKLTVGIAVYPETFNEIRAANGSPALADAPADQEVFEFELEFAGDHPQHPRLDILTTKAPGGGAIARFLEKFGEGIQQVEVDVTDVDRATEILRTRFQIEPIYPRTRPGANGTRVNFFLVTTPTGKKVLVELVEQPIQRA